ncbi:MAG: cytochrome c [Pseudohongiellaceae bacterium]
MNKPRVFFASAAMTAALTLACTSAVVADEPETIADGAFTEEQVNNGQALYEEHCSSCHNMGFYEDSLGNRVNQPVSFMFEEVLGTMPLNAPGFLPIETYEDIFAYIFSGLGFPAGDTELRYDSGMMDQVRLVQPD